MKNTSSFDAGSGLKFSQPAIVAAVAYAVLLIFVLMPIDMYEVDKHGNEKKVPYNIWGRLLLMFLLLFPYILSIYSLNCMTVGGCNVWSWIVGIVTVFWSFIVVVYALYNKQFIVNDVLP